MSKKAAHVNNKMDLIIYLDAVQVEHITVHPNMFQVPRVGDVYRLTTFERNLDEIKEDELPEVGAGRNRNVLTIEATVFDVGFDNAIMRTRRDGRYSTELLQTVHLYLKPLKVS